MSNKNEPHVLDIKKDKNYAWCQCNESEGQPFCDGSHTKINKQRENLVENLKEISFITKDSQKFVLSETKEPLIFTAENDSEVSLCGCKESINAPFCSGEHVNI